MSNADRFKVKTVLLERGASEEDATALVASMKTAISAGQTTATEICEKLGLTGWYHYDLKGADFPEGQYQQASAR